MPQINLTDEIVTQITTVLDLAEPTKQTSDGDELFAVSQLVAKAVGINLIKPNKITDSTTLKQLQTIMEASKSRMRTVYLRNDWWKKDNGALLVFRKLDKKAYALIADKKGNYNLIDRENNKQVLTTDIANSLEEIAYYFYRGFVTEKLNWHDIVRFIRRDFRADFRHVIILQIITGLLSLLVPIATGALLADAVPSADYNLLWQFLIALIMMVLTSNLARFSQVLALMRLRFRINSSMQAALWDRLLRLPVKFFQQFNAGDLALRTAGIDQIQQELSDSFLLAIFSSITLIFSLGLMFFYAPLLAVVAALLAVINAVINLITLAQQLKYLRNYLTLQGRLSSLVLQIFTNIGKLRIANAEIKLFKKWSNQLVEKTKTFFQVCLNRNRLVVFNVSYSILVVIILFALVVAAGNKLSFGAFIAFNAAFGQFFAGLLGITNGVTNVLKIIPLYERAQPVLTTLPENYNNFGYCPILSGKVAINQVNFYYDTDKTTLVLQNISLQIQPGEMIALVGPSGAGKSTLLRLLLGFDFPSHGQILFDDIETNRLDLCLLRQQLGAVLQNNFLLSGTLLENIMGDAVLTLEQVWQAAEMAAFADDIKAMPMSMHTFVNEGGRTLSAGQRQRLLLARAIARKPRILLLDEATSALDNITQAKIQQNLAAQKITRIVVAHRLSTIMQADQIYVFDQGKIVQTGTFQQLLNTKGLFADMAKMQMI